MTRILLVGGGRMGRALATGWRDAGDAELTIVEPNAAAAAAMRAAVPNADILDDRPAEGAFDALVFAVKPQAAADVAPRYAAFAAGGVFLSIAAGLTTARFAEWLGSDARIVRAMPNTPAAIGKGVSALFAQPAVSDAQRALCARLMAAAGAVEWVEREALIDAVTAVSGSGPAYVFHMVEALASAGTALGLPPETAMRLARATVVGAGALMDADAEPAAALREAVTSPGGTTAAALGVLMDDAAGLPPLMARTCAAAADRAKALASS